MPQLRLLASLACASSTGIGDEGTGRLEPGGRGAAVMPTLHGGGCLPRAAAGNHHYLSLSLTSTTSSGNWNDCVQHHSKGINCRL